MFYESTVDPTVNEFAQWLQQYGIPISLIVAGVVFLTVLVFFIIAMYRRKHEPLQEIKERNSHSNEMLLALGGESNIESHSLTGSRISIVLKNYDLLDEQKLNALGIDSIIRMSNKITLVIKDDASSLYKDLFSL